MSIVYKRVLRKVLTWSLKGAYLDLRRAFIASQKMLFGELKERVLAF